MWQNIVIKMVLGLLGKYLAAIFKQMSDKKTMDRLTVLAGRHVENFSKSETMTNDEKRKAAAKALVEDAKREGLNARDLLIDTATQVAYGFMKAKLEEKLSE